MNDTYLKTLADKELIGSLARLRSDEREVIYQILLHLGEVEKRKLHLEYGHSSLFAYCTKALGYSEAAAQRRIVAARCIREHPEIGARLKNGELSLSNICAATSVITAENKHEVVQSISGVSRREAEARLLKHRPAKKRVLERVKAVRVDTSTEPTLFDKPSNEMSVERYQLQFGVTAECLSKLEQVKALVSHRASGRSLEGVMELLLDEYLLKHSPEEKNKRRKARMVRTSCKTTRTRSIPAAVRDEVYVRDAGQCSFVGADGVRCCSTHALEIDHIVPFAMGGEHSSENLRLLCRAHNQFAAEKVFGREWMEQCRQSA